MKFLTVLLQFLKSKFKRVDNNDNEKSKENSPKNMRLKVIFSAVTVLLLAILVLAFFFLEGPYVPDDLYILTDADKALFQSVRHGNVNEVRRRLLEGGNAHAIGDFGTTPFRAAIALDRVDVFRELIEAERGDDVGKWNSLLVYAVVQNRPRIVKELTALLPNIDSIDRNGYTPLLYAIDRNHVNVARELLDAGADVNAQGRAGVSPLIAAVRRGKPDMVAELLKAGADWRVMSPSGDTAMSIARERRGRELIVGLLIEAENPADAMTHEDYMRLPEDMNDGEDVLI